MANFMKAKGRGRRGGYTLLEMLVVISIIVALTTLGLASFAAYATKRGFRTAVETIAGTFRMARQTAISDRQPVFVEIVDVDKDTDPSNDESCDRVIVYKAERQTDSMGKISDTLIRQAVAMEGDPPHCTLEDVQPLAVVDLPDRIYWSHIPGNMVVKEERIKVETYKTKVANPDFNPNLPEDPITNPKTIEVTKERVYRKTTLLSRPFFKFHPDGTVESVPYKSPPTKEYPASTVRVWDQASDQEAQIYISPATGYVKVVYRDHPVVSQTPTKPKK